MGMDEAHPVLMPIGQDYSDSTTSNSDCLEIRSVKKPTIKKFQSLAGSLLWFARCTRPDISFSVYKLTRSTHAPTTADWALGVRVVKYLKGTKTMKLYLGGESEHVAQIPARYDISALQRNNDTLGTKFDMNALLVPDRFDIDIDIGFCVHARGK
ncbi:unnamed protein product [Albugo candida]|uniref:Reverse transcriptase Ty1/copia-type domain-containing protein n=1 Tax=Albugo candida TaxID=65357 RepID=A0A024FVQ0_9STRA|nr:unnamed protein product [Albugo candida]|eukprot:CCI10739.1 unnamed protein product [Albugo candida]